MCVRPARPSGRARCGAGDGCSAIKCQSLQWCSRCTCRTSLSLFRPSLPSENAGRSPLFSRWNQKPCRHSLSSEAWGAAPGLSALAEMCRYLPGFTCLRVRHATCLKLFSGRLKFTVRRHQFNKDSLLSGRRNAVCRITGPKPYAQAQPHEDGPAVVDDGVSLGEKSDVGKQTSRNKTPCNVTPVILDGVVSPEYSGITTFMATPRTPRCSTGRAIT